MLKRVSFKLVIIFFLILSLIILSLPVHSKTTLALHDHFAIEIKPQTYSYVYISCNKRNSTGFLIFESNINIDLLILSPDSFEVFKENSSNGYPFVFDRNFAFLNQTNNSIGVEFNTPGEVYFVFENADYLDDGAVPNGKTAVVDVEVFLYESNLPAFIQNLPIFSKYLLLGGLIPLIILGLVNFIEKKIEKIDDEKFSLVESDSSSTEAKTLPEADYTKEKTQITQKGAKRYLISVVVSFLVIVGLFVLAQFLSGVIRYIYIFVGIFLDVWNLNIANLFKSSEVKIKKAALRNLRLLPAIQIASIGLIGQIIGENSAPLYSQNIANKEQLYSILATLSIGTTLLAGIGSISYKILKRISVHMETLELENTRKNYYALILGLYLHFMFAGVGGGDLIDIMTLMLAFLSIPLSLYLHSEKKLDDWFLISWKHMNTSTITRTNGFFTIIIILFMSFNYGLWDINHSFLENIFMVLLFLQYLLILFSMQIRLNTVREILILSPLVAIFVLVAIYPATMPISRLVTNSVYEINNQASLIASVVLALSISLMCFVFTIADTTTFDEKYMYKNIHKVLFMVATFVSSFFMIYGYFKLRLGSQNFVMLIVGLTCSIIVISFAIALRRYSLLNLKLSKNEKLSRIIIFLVFNTMAMIIAYLITKSLFTK